MLSVPVGHADIIHLKGGGKIVAASWKIEGTKVTIETRAGTISIDRSDIVSIEKKGEAPSSSEGSWKVMHDPPKNPQPQLPGGPLQGPQAQIPTQPSQGSPPPSRSTSRGPESEWMAIGRDALEKKEYERALSSFLAALASDPDAAEASLGASRAALALNDAAAAAAHARRAVSIDPSSVAGWTLLSAAEYRKGNLAASKEALETSQLLSPGTFTQTGIDRIAREQAAATGLSAIHSANFRMEFDAGSAPRLARESLVQLDAAYDEMTRLFQHRPAKSLDVILYPRQSFHELTGLGEEVLGLFDGKVRIPTGGPDQLGPEDRRVLRHELAHAFIHSKTRGNCPRWLHEGLAQRIEPRSVSQAEVILLMLIASDPDYARHDSCYASALSFVNYLWEKQGASRMMTLLEKLGEGTSMGEACQSAIGPSCEDLAKEWLQSLNARPK